MENGTRGGGVRGGRASSAQNAYQDVYEGTTEKRLASSTDKHLSKAHLRSYIGQDSPFFLSGAQNEEEFFAARCIARTRTAENCEGFNRLGYFLSFPASNSEVGADV